MEEGPSSTQQDEEDEDGDGDDVPQVQVTIVNEADLESSSKILLLKQYWILTFYNSCEGFLRQNSFNPCVQFVTVTNPRIGFLVCSLDSRS
jgi:hypothetical protein